MQALLEARSNAGQEDQQREADEDNKQISKISHDLPATPLRTTSPTDDLHRAQAPTSRRDAHSIPTVLECHCCPPGVDPTGQ